MKNYLSSSSSGSGGLLLSVVVVLLIGILQVQSSPAVGKVESSPSSSTSVPILRPPPSSDDDEDDAVIIEADGPPSPSLPEPDFDTKDCLLPRVKGPCRAIIESWYYSSKSKRCESFQWSGCGGNNNRFSAKEFCQTHCSQDKLEKISKDSLTKPNNGTKVKCEENPCGPRKCGVVMDPSTGCLRCECDDGAAAIEDEKLPIGSVSGNPDTSSIKPKLEKPEDVCILPETRGNCRAMMTRWRYNAEIKECVQFHFGGCDGNSNNFVSKEKCQAFCRGQ